MRYRLLVLALACSACAAASAPMTPAASEALARADALLLQGCLDCLLDARREYERSAVGKTPPRTRPRPHPLLASRLFETDLLIALREKELAMPADSDLQRARALASALPAALDAERYIRLVEMIPPDSTGSSRRDREAFVRQYQDAATQIDGDIVWLDSAALREPFRRYLALALHCSYPVRGGRLGSTLPLPTRMNYDALPPLVAYRAATCTLPRVETLRSVRQRSPRFVETSIALGEAALPLVEYNGPQEAGPLLAEAYAVFPESPTVTFLNGALYEAAGDCDTALRYYDETLTIADTHEDALLGRTACLSALRRTDEAIQTATRLIALGSGNQGEARYWRAWNRYRMKDPAGARQDIDLAKRLWETSRVYAVAGMIEHDQDSLDLAERDLHQALELNQRNCTAMRYLGMVDFKRARWPSSATSLVAATACYDTAADDAAKRLSGLQQRTDLDPQFHARRASALRAEIEDDRSQASAAAFNAAANFLRAGDIPRASRYADRAAQDPARTTDVAELRRLINAAAGIKRPR